MSGFIEGENRYQSTLFPEQVSDKADPELSKISFGY